MSANYVELSFETSVAKESNYSGMTFSTKKIFVPAQDFSLQDNPNPMERDDEMRGINDSMSVLKEKFNPSWELTTRLYPDLAGFFFKWLFGTPTTTAGDGIITDLGSVVIPVGCYRHRFAAPFSTPSGNFPYTCRARIGYVDQTAYRTAYGLGVEKVSISTPDSGGCIIKLSGRATYLEAPSGSSHGLTPSYEASSVRPFERSNLTLPAWLSGSATHENLDVECDRPLNVDHTLGGGSKYPDTVEKGDMHHVITGTLDQRYIDNDDLTALINATGFAGGLSWANDTVIASGYPYKVNMQMPNVQYVGGSTDPVSNKNRHGAKFNWKATYDSSASATLEVVNATTSYA